MPLALAARHLLEGSLPARALAITFDDGYADNHDVALPILQKHGLSATFFVASGFLDGGRMWNDTVVEALRRTAHDSLDFGAAGLPGIGHLALGSVSLRQQAIGQLLGAIKYLEPVQRQRAVETVARISGAVLPTDLMMSSAQVRSLHLAGMGLGGHTVNHPILARLSETAAFDEMQAGKLALESLTQAPVDVFAYPNGRPDVDYTVRDARLAARAGFKAAVSTAWGASKAGDDVYQLRRFTPWDRSKWRFGVRLALNITKAGGALAH